MVAQTQAQVAFTGSGNLGQIIDKINDSVKNFGVSTGKATKGLNLLNKEAKSTDGIFKTLSTNVKSTADGFLGLGRNTKNTLNFFTTAGQNTLKFSDAVENANKGISGLGLKFLGLKKQTSLLNNVLEGPAFHLGEIADASNNTERAFIILSKIAKPLRQSLLFLSQQAENLASFFVKLEAVVVRLVKQAIELAVKAINFFGNAFSNLAKTVARFGAVGKIVSGQFNNISKSLATATMRAKEFSGSLNPEELERVDKAGEKVSSVFGRLSKGLETAAAGVILADTLGKVVRRFVGAQQAAQDVADTISTGFEAGSEVFERTGAQTQLFNNRLTAASASAKTLGNIFNDNLLKGLGTAAAKANSFIAVFQGIKVVTEGISDAVIQMSGLNEAFSQAQALGIDTTAAEIAFQFGLVGERLLFSAEAAKEFGRTAVSAFAQTEDAAAFVTTLSSGARLQFGELEAGLNSVTAFSTELANSLDNTVTSGEAAFALYNTLSAGVGIAADSTQDLTAQQNFLEAALKLSSGTGADAAETLSLLATTTKVYGLSANDAALTAAKLNQVVEQGQITFPQLTNQLGRTLATAEATNVTLDETLASIAALTKVQGEDALVGFSSLLSAVAGQGAQAKKEIQELGIQFDLQTIKSKGLNESLNDLVVATGGNAEVLKRIIPDTLAFQTALTLVNSVGQDVTSTLDNIANTGEDSLESVFSAAQQSTVKQFTNIMNGFNEVLVDFGQRVQPALQPGLDALRGLLNVFQNLPEPVKNAIGLLVVAQTAISNIGGGLLSLGLTFGKLILSVIAFRLVNKALTGQLNSELDVLKQLVTVEGDYAGALTRLIGLNENFSSATIQTTKALNNTKKALDGIQAQGFNIDNDSLEEFERVLVDVRMRIKEVNRSPLKFTDPEGTAAQLKTLKALQSQIQETIATTNVARKLTLKETRTNIDEALKEVNVSASQRIDRFKELLLGLVNPNLVGGRSERFQKEIRDLFDEPLSDASLTAEEKVGKIADTFKELKREAPSTVRGFLSEVEAELFSGFGRIEGQADRLKMTVSAVSQGLFANSPMSVRMAFDNAVEELQAGFLDMEATLKQRKQPLSEVFRRTVDALPEELDNIKPKLIAETDKLLDASRGSIESRVTDFNKSFAKLVSGLPDALRQQAGEVKAATQELTRAIEAPLAGRDNFGVQFAKAAINIRNGVDTIKNVAPVAKEGVMRVNEEISNLAGPETRQDINQNLKRIEGDVKDFSDDTKKKIDQVANRGNRTFGALTDSLDGLGGVLGSVSPRLAGVLDATSNFLSNSRELSGGLGELGKITKNYNSSLKTVAGATANTTQAQGVLAATNRLLGRSMFGASASANAFAKAATSASASSGVLTGVSAIASAGMAGLTSAFTVATTAAGSFIATLAPIAIPVAAIAGGLFLLFKAAQELIPAFGRLTDGNKRLAAQIEDTNENVEDSLDLFKKYRDSSEGFGRDAEGNAESLAKMKMEFEAVNEAASDDRPPKAFVQGFRGAILNVAELSGMLANQVLGFLAKLPVKIAEVTSELLSRLPIVGKAFEVLANGFKFVGDSIDKLFRERNDSLRNFFNTVREDTQAFIARGAIEAAQEAEALTNLLLAETDKVRVAQKQGDVAAERSKAIVEAAEQANRALSANELNEVIREENQLARVSIELVKEQIKAREEELEKAKDPTVRANLEFQLENLKQQATELEKRNALQEEFLRNQQAIGQNIQANNAAQSQKAVNEQLQNTITDLGRVENGGERAQEIFSNILGVVKQVNDETGDLQFIRPESVNQASQAGRRAELAVQSTVAKVSTQIANLNNIDANLTQDDVAQGIFQVFDAVDKAVAEDPRFAEQGANILNSILTQGAEASGAEGTIASIFSPNQITEIVERQTSIIETEFAQRTKAQEKSIKRINILQEQGIVTSVQAARDTAKAQESIDQERTRSIQRRIDAVNSLGLKGSQEEKSLISELEQFEIQSNLNRLNERRKILEEELNLLRAQKENEIQLLKNDTQGRINTIQLTQKATQQEQKALESRRNLVQSVGQFEETILQNRLKLTGDVEEQAEIQLELAKQRIDISEQENMFERDNIMLQQELNKLALEREQIQLRIQAAESEAELAANATKLAKADELGLSQEEVVAIELQNEALTMQGNLLRDSQAQLNDFAEKQEDINQQELEALDLRQKAQRAAADVDLELAERNRVLAVFDKQIQRARTQSKIVDLTNQARKSGLEEQSQLLEGQNNILQEQKSLLDSTADVLQSNFQIAIDAERNSFRRRRLEEQAARTRLNTIKAQQEIEETIFKLNEQQRDLAIEVRQIELQASREKLKADLAVAQAEAARTAADPTKTSEEIEASRLAVRAAEAQLRAAETQQSLLAQERALNAQQSGLRTLQFQQRQENEVFQARASLAQTTLTRNDDRAIGREALLRTQQQQQQLSSLISNFATPGGVPSNIAQLGNAQNGSANSNIDGNIRINLNVEGEPEVVNRIDQRTLNAKISEGVFTSLEQLFDYTNRRR